MKNYNTPWSIGSVFICNKCGIAFEQPENAENLKKDLRIFLKEKGAHHKIRVMVSGCLDICEKKEQAVTYQPIEGRTAVFTVNKDFETAKTELKNMLDEKLSS